MSVFETASRFIAEHGEAMTLSRTGHADIPLKGKRYGSSTEDLGNSALQQSFRVRVGTDELSASPWAVKEPKRGDKLLIDGRPRAVRDSVPLKDGDVVAMYELEVAG